MAALIDTLRYVYFDVMWRRISHIQGRGTLGLGLGGGVAAGIGGVASLGVYWDWDGSIAFGTLEAGGIASTGLLGDAELWAQSTTAESLDELFAGPDVFLGANATLGPGVGADIIFSGQGSNGAQIIGMELSANLGAAVSPEFPIAPVEIHAGASTTILGPLLQVNFYDILGLTRPSLRQTK